MTTRENWPRSASALTLLGLTVLCAACSPMRQKLDANPGGYLVSSYSHTGAKDGDGSQVFALNTNPVSGGIESGAVYLESVNGEDYSIASTYGHPYSEAGGFGAFNGHTWPQYSIQRGGLLLNAPGSFNNHLVMVAPPRSTTNTSGFTGAASRPPTSTTPSAMPRSSMSRSVGSRAMRPAASRSATRGTSRTAQERTR